MGKSNEKKNDKYKQSTIDLNEFRTLDNEGQKAKIRAALEKMWGDSVKVEEAHINKIFKLTMSPIDDEIYLPKKVLAEKTPDKVILSFTKKTNPVFFIFLFGLLLLVAGFSATYSGFVILKKQAINVDIDGDGIPDINLDIDGDDIPDINVDTNKDKKPNLNIDYKGNRTAVFNLDKDGDGKPDFNLVNDATGNKKCEINCDANGDGTPDYNIDTNNDGKPDIRIVYLATGDKTCEVNCDTNGDGWPDYNIDTDGDGTPDIFIDTNGDKVPDLNFDIDNNGTCDYYCDNNNDNVCDTRCGYKDDNTTCTINCDVNGDGTPDYNIDTDNDGKPDKNLVNPVEDDKTCLLNCDKDGDGWPDYNIDTDDDGEADRFIDVDGDKNPDLNFDVDGDGTCDYRCDKNGDGICDYRCNYPNTDETRKVCTLNCDANGDGWPDYNIDLDGDGNPDIDIDVNGDGIPELNIDTNGDCKPDLNIDNVGDRKCHENCTIPEYNEDEIKQSGPSIIIGDDNSNTKSANLMVVYEDDGPIVVDGLFPDDQTGVDNIVPTKKFSVTNDSKYSVSYKISWTGVQNTYVTDHFQYRIESNNGGYNQAYTEAPKNDRIIRDYILIPPHTTHNYTITFKLVGTNMPQNEDQGKVFIGTIKVGE
jgi:hypothetical protein